MFASINVLHIAALRASGTAMVMDAGMKNAFPGWHSMAGFGLLMLALFGHLFFGRP